MHRLICIKANYNLPAGVNTSDFFVYLDKVYRILNKI